MITDINFSMEYARAYESHEGGTAEEFRYRGEHGEISNLYIKRPLTGFAGFEDHCDMITPYGYGGPVIRHCTAGKEAQLVEEYRLAFERFCAGQKAVSFFARFNPIEGNALPFRSCFDQLALNRQVVVVDLGKDILMGELSKKSRKKYRSAQRAGFAIEWDDNCDTLHEMIDLYNVSMQRKHADDYYFFGGDYYRWLIEVLPGAVHIMNVRYETQLVCTMLYFDYGDVGYAHLGARSQIEVAQNSKFLTNVELSLRLQEKGCKYLMLGGGLSPSADDSLLFFKKQFTLSPLRDFYLGRKIFDRDAYNELCALAGHTAGEPGTDYFPLYRSVSKGSD